MSHHLLGGAFIVAESLWLEGYDPLLEGDARCSARWYPLAVADPAARVVGDVVAIPTKLWPALDAYEGAEYKRIYLK